MKNVTIKIRIKKMLRRTKRNVFLRSDFKMMGDYAPVGRALNSLTTEGLLIKLGYGLYAKAMMNRITGEPMLAADGGFFEVAVEALERLEQDWYFSGAMADYINGATQIPMELEVTVNKKFSRKIKTDKFELIIQRHK